MELLCSMWMLELRPARFHKRFLIYHASSCFGYTRYGKYPGMRSKAAQNRKTHPVVRHSECPSQLVQIAHLTKFYSVCDVDLKKPSNEEDG